MELLQSLLDTSSHAIFTLDREGIITHINQQAKNRFGLYNHSQHSHPAGRLEPGDLVLVADTEIGADDGELRPEDLERIGIREPRLRTGDRLVAVGAFDDPGQRPVYKFLPGQDAESLQLETVWDGIPLRLSIEPHTVSVQVRDTTYSIDYFQCIGQLVALERGTGRVKFWEEKGYSARKEGAGSLLRGGAYIEKRPGLEMKVVGYHFREFFEGERFERHLARIFSGQVPRYEDAEYEINGYELVASLLPVPGADGLPGEVIVKFRSIEDIHTTILERNNAIKSAERTYRESARSEAPQEAPFAELFGFGTTAAAVRHLAYKLSQLDCNILITGESGTGKSFLAQTIARAQPRKGPYVPVDCSTLSPTLFESEMFGYVGGAFTGANPRGKAGFFEAADGGTIFLDEIGEIPLHIQAKLLNVIQNKVVVRVGSTRTIPVDVRILAATNRDLKAEVAAGRFRQDLYYRLSAFSVELPPLRNCPEDICFLIDRLMEKIPQKYGVPPKSLSGEAFDKLLSYNWPGNIRELENVLERAVALSESELIYAEHICVESQPVQLTLRERLKQEEKRILRQTLAQCGGSRSQAMKLLGLSKTVFYGKLKEYQIS